MIKNIRNISIIIAVISVFAMVVLVGYKVWSPKEIMDIREEEETRTTQRYKELGQISYEHAEPGIYHQGSSDYINGEPAWNAGKFIPWSELEKRGIMIVRQGKLSTPMDFTSEESDFCNYLAVEYIDGMIVLPDHITSIAKGTFFHCNITGICLPESLEHIGAGAFAQCHLLKEIHLPKNVEKLDGAPFAGCDSLARITVSEENRWYDSRDNCNAIIRTDNNRLIAGCRETVIPDNIESVEECACENWIDRKEIDLPVVDSLADDNISDEKETAYPPGFAEPELKSHEKSEAGIYIKGHIKYTEEKGIFIEDIRITWRQLEQEGMITIKDGILSTEVDAIEGNYMTRNYMTGAVVLPDSVKTVAKDTFKDCSIEELIIPEGVVTIEEDAFNACKKLTRITLPESLKKIGKSAFSHCGIKSLEVPDSVKKIGSGAFEGISHIEYRGTATYRKDSKYWGAKSMN